MKKRVWFAFLLCISALQAQSVVESWVARYDGPSSQDDRATAIALDVAGNIYITGVSVGSGTGLDIVTIKYFPDGTVAWIARSGSGDTDLGNDIVVDVPGNAYVVGNVGAEIGVIKYNPDGTEAWLRTFSLSTTNSQNEGVKIALDFGGDVIVGGHGWNSQSTPQTQDMVVQKYNSGGDLLWSAALDGAENYDELRDLAVDVQGNIYITGRSDSTNIDVLTIALTPEGQEKWRHRYFTTGSQVPHALAVDRNSNVFVTGTGSGVGNDYLTLRYDSLGTLVWAHLPDLLSQDVAFDVATTGSAVYVTGRAGGNFRTVKYDYSGTPKWIEEYDATDGNTLGGAFVLAIDANQNVYVTGLRSVANGVTDYLTLKYGANHQGGRGPLWTASYNGTGNHSDFAADIAVDAHNNVYVTGESRGIGTRQDMVTIQYGQPGFGGTPADCWLVEDFENVHPGALHGQNGWEVVPGRTSPNVIANPFGLGQVLKLDPGVGETVIIGKKVNEQVKGIQRIQMQVLVDGNLDEREPTLAKLEVRTDGNPNWDKKFQLYFGAHFRLNYGPLPANAEIYLPANELETRRWYQVEAVLDLASNTVDILLDGIPKLSGIAMGPGAITDISISAWDRPGAVFYDDLLFCPTGEGTPSDTCFAHSFFDTDDEGWTVTGDAQGGAMQPDYFPDGGNPGGYISAADNVVGGTWYWNAPAKFLGDKSCAYNRALNFDLRQSDLTAQFTAPDVLLFGAGLVLAFDTPFNPGLDWTRFSVPLTETAGWRVGALNGPPATQQEFQTVLAALDSLWIRGEFHSGANIGGLDNVTLGGGVRGVGPVVFHDLQLDDDDTGGSNGNGNGIPEKGETVEVLLSVRNSGILAAVGLSGTISTADPEVTLLQSSLTFPDVPPDSIRNADAPILFSINPALNGQKVVLFTLTVTAANGGPWISTFEIAIGQKPENKIFVVDINIDEFDGECLIDCSLRDAILLANQNRNLNSATPDSIRFHIGTGGFSRISPESALPEITEAVVIDGLTQPGAHCNTWPPVLQIELDGSNAGPSSNGLWVTDGSAEIRGLIINRFGGPGIELAGSDLETNRITCNFIGTDSSGTVPLGNGQAGILIWSALNQIGGLTQAERNLISANAGDGISILGGAVILGNYIGTDVTGTLPLGNAGDGVLNGEGGQAIIGGPEPGAGNLISANGRNGITAEFSGNTRIEGNRIGTDVTGAHPLGNAENGVSLENISSGNITQVLHNTITDNGNLGISILESTTQVVANAISRNDSGGVRVDNPPDPSYSNRLEENLISYNGGAGISVVSGIMNDFQRNRIFANQGLGIDLVAPDDPPSGVTPNDVEDVDEGPNHLMNFPVVTSATLQDSMLSIDITLHTLPLIENIRIEVFANAVCNADTADSSQAADYGEGETFLFADTVNSGILGEAGATFRFVPPVPVEAGQFITATATFPDSSTSEFSRCRVVEAATGIDSSAGVRITTYELAQNYPNPFNPGTQIRYQLPETAEVSLLIYNALGQQVRRLIAGEKKSAGRYQITWDGRDQSGHAVASGVYFYRLTAKNSRRTAVLQRKMLLLK